MNNVYILKELYDIIGTIMPVSPFQLLDGGTYESGSVQVP